MASITPLLIARLLVGLSAWNVALHSLRQRASVVAAVPCACNVSQQLSRCALHNRECKGVLYFSRHCSKDSQTSYECRCNSSVPSLARSGLAQDAGDSQPS